MGYFSGIGFIFLFSGIIGMIPLFIQKYVCNQEDIEFTSLTKKSFLIMINFIVNNIASTLTYGLAPKGDVLLQVTVTSYLWVILLNIFLVTILKYKIKNRILFYSGIICGLLGIVIACVGFNFSNANFISYFPKYYYVYGLSILSAFTWAYYSTLLTKWAKSVNDDHVYISMIISGTIMILISVTDSAFNNYKHMSFDFVNCGLFLYEVLIATCLPYYLWNIAYKYGNVKIVSNFSILTPIINVITVSLLYGLNLLDGPIFGSILLIAAIVCCKNSVEEKKSQAGQIILPTIHDPIYDTLSFDSECSYEPLKSSERIIIHDNIEFVNV